MDGKQLELDFSPKPELEDAMNSLDRMLYQAYRNDLERGSAQRRRRAVKGLAGLPKFADTSTSLLEKALKDRDYDVRQAAAAALRALRFCP